MELIKYWIITSTFLADEFYDLRCEFQKWLPSILLLTYYYRFVCFADDNLIPLA